eukprot:4090993-Pyramimonas_sp.AAC.1
MGCRTESQQYPQACPKMARRGSTDRPQTMFRLSLVYSRCRGTDPTSSWAQASTWSLMNRCRPRTPRRTHQPPAAWAEM